VEGVRGDREAGQPRHRRCELAGLKALYSDARKRAGVGAYLYTILEQVVLPIFTAPARSRRSADPARATCSPSTPPPNNGYAPKNASTTPPQTSRHFHTSSARGPNQRTYRVPASANAYEGAVCSWPSVGSRPAAVGKPTRERRSTLWLRQRGRAIFKGKRKPQGD
jgi:hypothetical protein